MSVVLSITELEVGGAERCLVNLACGLKRLGFAPRVVALAPPPEGNRQLLEKLVAERIHADFLGLRRVWEFPQATKRMSALLADIRPDILQSFLFHANVVSCIAAEKSGIDRVFTGIRVADPSRTRHWIERRVTARAERIICVSQAVADSCRRQGYAAERLQVIPNGIDVAQIDRVEPADLESLGLPPGRRAIVFVGRLHRQKGLDWLFQQVGSLLETHSQHDLLLVGEGPDRKRLERTIGRTIYGSRVHFLGWRSDAVAILKASDLLLLPSRWEGMPNVILEAMAAGRPVVATRVEGVDELLGPLADVQVVPSGDQVAFQMAVGKILVSPAWVHELGEQNRARATSHFSLSSMVQAYANLYRQV